MITPFKPWLALPAPNYRAIEQPFLFSPEVVREITKAEARGEYTAQRLKLQRPATYNAIIELRGQDYGQLRIARLLGVHHRTVAAVDDAEAESIDIVRHKLAKNLRRAAVLQVERLNNNPDSVPIHVAGLIASQLIDKAELLEGRATVRSEHYERVDIYSDWPAFVEQLPSEKEVAGHEIGLVAGKNPANALPASDAGELDQVNGSRHAADQESDDCARVPQQRAADVTGNDPGEALQEANSGRPDGHPRGGGRHFEGATEEATGVPPRKFSSK